MNFDNGGRPAWAELAWAALSEAHMRTGHEADVWLRRAEIHARLANAEQAQNLARSNRELAEAMNAVASEHRLRRTGNE